MAGPSGVTYALIYVSDTYIQRNENKTYLSHSTINNEISTVDEAALVTGKEKHSLSLLNRLTKAPSWEVHLASVALGLIITQPILKERRVQRRRAKRVEPVALTSMHNSQLPGHGENGTLAGGVGELRSCGSDQCDHGGGVDDRTLGLLVSAKGENGMLGAVPYALDVDVVREVPDLVGGVDGVCIVISPCHSW